MKKRKWYYVLPVVLFILLFSLTAGCFTIDMTGESDGSSDEPEEQVSQPVASEDQASPSTTPEEPVAKPVINSFSADQGTIDVEQTATLSWDVSGATTVTIDQGIGDVPLTGIWAVSPSSTTTYTLTAANEGGSVTAATKIIVSPPPPPDADFPVINSFVANPVSIIVGGSAILSWSVTNADTVVINPGLGTVAAAGGTSVSPDATTTYTLTATNADGSRSKSAKITVNPKLMIKTPIYIILKPDLVVSAIKKYEGDDIVVYLDNIGNMGIQYPDRKINIRVYVDSVKKEDVSPNYGSIPAGGSWHPVYRLHLSGSHAIKVIVDSQNFEESDETNNQRGATINF